jgi:hypothetical protein
MSFPWHCHHDWGFPRRWPEFDGKRNADVQRCLRCGEYRLSPVQFGSVQQPTDQTKGLEAAQKAC